MASRCSANPKFVAVGTSSIPSPFRLDGKWIFFHVGRQGAKPGPDAKKWHSRMLFQKWKDVSGNFHGPLFPLEILFPSASLSSHWAAKQSWREAEEPNPPLSHACDFGNASPSSNSTLRLWNYLLKRFKVPSRPGCSFPDSLIIWE